MPKDRDQLTPEEPEDLEKLESSRGQGTAGTGWDRLPGETSPRSMRDGDEEAEDGPPA